MIIKRVADCEINKSNNSSIRFSSGHSRNELVAQQDARLMKQSNQGFMPDCHCSSSWTWSKTHLSQTCLNLIKKKKERSGLKGAQA